MSVAERPARKSVKTRCWHGSRTELKRLIDLFSEQQLKAEAAVEDDVARKTEEHEARWRGSVDAVMKSFDPPLSTTSDLHVRDLLFQASPYYPDAMDRLRLQRARPVMTVVYEAEFNSKDQGHPEDVFKRLDVSQATSITLEFGSLVDEDDVAGRVTLNRDSCEAEFRGNESFVAAALGRFENHFRQRRPNYAWLRSQFFLLPFAFLTSTVATALLTFVLPPLSNDFVQAVYVPIFLAIFFGQYVLVRWLVPAFELYEDHKRSRSQFALGALGAILLSLIAGIILLPAT